MYGVDVSFLNNGIYEHVASGESEFRLHNINGQKHCSMAYKVKFTT